MVDTTSSDRSLAPITPDDLTRLARIAQQDREDFFERKPTYRVLADRLITVALCQGAALHFLDGWIGIKDFDVWSFYAEHPEVMYPPRRRVARDFGDAKFGQSPDQPGFVGRRSTYSGAPLTRM